jgi:hypothetical protein
VLVRSRHRFAPIILGAALLAIGPALADKPDTPLDRATAPSPSISTATTPSTRHSASSSSGAGLPNPAFGGYSALAVDPARLCWPFPMPEAGSRPPSTCKPLLADVERDSEGMALIEGTPKKGTAYISFERTASIVIRSMWKASVHPSGSISLPAGTKRMSMNSALEALALIPSGKLKGTLVAFAENLTDKNGNLQGWLIGGPTPGPIALKRIGGFNITDAAPLPERGIVVLERRFRYSEGVKMRIRRIAEAELKRGSLIEGETLLEAEDNLNIDNMEGIAAHRAASGETILNSSRTIISACCSGRCSCSSPCRGRRLRTTQPAARFVS